MTISATTLSVFVNAPPLQVDFTRRCFLRAKRSDKIISNCYMYRYKDCLSLCTFSIFDVEGKT